MSANELLRRLTTIYSGEPIRYPNLRAISLAQWMLESGRATSDLATRHYNFGGLKWRPEMAMYASKVKYEAHDGEDYYCKFATLENFIAGYWAFLNRSPYSGWESHIDSGEQFIRFIGPVYTPSAGYADQVLALLSEAQALLHWATNEADIQPQVGRNLGTVILDPGHGGEKKVGGSSPNNAISVSGVKEKKLTLEFCLILRDLLLKEAADNGETVRVVLTRTSDVNLGIAERAGFALTEMAKALICVHFNGFHKPETRGAETYYRSAGNGNRNLEADVGFARVVHGGLMAGMKAIDKGAVDRGVKPDDQTGPGQLGLLNDLLLGNHKRANKCVAAYVEAEFISNAKVDRLLISGPDAVPNRTRLLEHVAVAVIEYLRAA